MSQTCKSIKSGRVIYIYTCILDIGISAQSREHSAIDTHLQSTAAFGPQYNFLMRDMNISSVSGF